MNENTTLALDAELLETGASAVEYAPEDRKKIFLAITPDDITDRRETFAQMLQKAGFDILPAGELPTDEAEFKKLVEQSLEESDCYLHLLGGEYGTTLSDARQISWGRYQFDRATAQSKKSGSKYKRLVWSLPLDGLVLQIEQADFGTYIQNNLAPDILFTNTENPAQLIEDIRSFLQKDLTAKIIPKEYDICFISNVQDAADCYETVEKLSEGLKVNTLTVVPENDTDYRAVASDMILRARFAVVYFKETSDWAISFTKQIWKTIQGASSGTPFLVIGEDEPRRNRFLHFRGPQILLDVVKKDEVLATIQKHHQRVKETGRVTDFEIAPYTGLRPFNEDESIFFKGRDRHNDTIIEMLQRNRFVMVTGSSGDGKSSLIYAGMIPTLKGGFLKTSFSKWVVADFRPERTPLRNLADAVAANMRLRNVDEVENQLSYGFSALVDIYKQSNLYCDMTGEKWVNANEEERRGMRRQAANLLILVDQFEEFFTNVENYRDGVASPLAQITVNVLIETIRIAREEGLPIYVVFTMRSDYIGQCVAFRGFAEMIGLSTYFVPRLKREEIQEVIQGPALLNGNDLSPRLAQRLLNDLGDGLDQLPVLQHSLSQIWTYADKGKQTLDLQHYARVGGLAYSKLPKEEVPVFEDWFRQLPKEQQALYEKPKLRNVLNRHANELYETAHLYYNSRYENKITKEDAQHILKVAFTCLTKIDENRAVRNRMSLQEVANMAGDKYDIVTIGRVINIFREPGNTFVQPFINADDPETREMQPTSVMDITHEALIRNWDRLVEWAEIENKSVSVYTDFKVQVNRWLNNDCSPKYLLTTGTYSYFNAWYQEQKPNAAWIRRYIRPDEVVPELEPMEQATQYLEDIDEFLGLSRQKIERNRRITVFAISLISILLLISVIVAIFANFQRTEALRAKTMAEQSAREAQRQRLIAENQKREAENQRLRAETERLRAEQQAIIADAQRKIALGQKLEADKQRRFAENQRRLAEYERLISENQRQIAETQQKLAENALQRAEVNRIEAQISNQISIKQRNSALVLQSLFLSSLSEEQVNEKNPQTGVLLALEGMPTDLSVPEADRNRPYVAETEASLYFALNSIINKRPVSKMVGHKNKVIYNSFSPDGTKLITTSWDKTARIWDVQSGRQLAILSGHTNIVGRAGFSKDSKYVVTYGDDFTARVWELGRNKLVSVARGHRDAITHVTMNSEGSKVSTASVDKTARIWNATNGNQLAVLSGHADVVNYVSFSPDGNRVVTASKDGTAKIWDANSGTLIATMSGSNGPVNYANFSPDGSVIATTSDDNTTRIWSGANGALLRTLFGHKAAVNDANFSHDSKRIVTASQDGTARIWNVNTGDELAQLKQHAAPVYSAGFSPNDQRIATTGEDNFVILWDANSYLRIADFKGHPSLGYSAAFSPNNKYLAMASDENFNVVIYQVFEGGQPLVDLARKTVPRQLSDDERRQFFLADKRVKKESADRTLLRLQEQKSVAQQEEERSNREIQTLPSIQELRKRLPARNAPKPASTAPAQETAPAPAPGSSAVTAPASTESAGIPASGVHTVSAGETLSRISRTYGVSTDELKRLNNLTDDRIVVGQQLKLK